MAKGNLSKLRMILLDLNVPQENVDNWLLNPKDKSVQKAVKLVADIDPDATDVASLNKQVDALAAVSGAKREAARRVVGRAYNVAIPNNPKVRTEADIAREAAAITASSKSSKPITMPSQPMPKGGGPLPDMRGEIDTPTPSVSPNSPIDDDLLMEMNLDAKNAPSHVAAAGASTTTPTRPDDIGHLWSRLQLGEGAANSKLLQDIDKGIKIEPTDANVKALFDDLGIKLPPGKEGATIARNVKRGLGRLAGDAAKMGKAGSVGQMATVEYATKVGGLLKLTQDAVAGGEDAIKELSTGKLRGRVSDLVSKLKPGVGRLAAGVIPAMALAPVTGALSDKLTGLDKTKNELRDMGTRQTFEDLWEQYQLQKAMSRAQSRMNVDFPNLMGAGGAPAGPPTAQMPTDPNANPGDIVLPGGTAQYDEEDYSPVA